MDEKRAEFARVNLAFNWRWFGNTEGEESTCVSADVK
jgi:hypothetical protein